jgi:hypothetical protein
MGVAVRFVFVPPLNRIGGRHDFFRLSSAKLTFKKPKSDQTSRAIVRYITS